MANPNARREDLLAKVADYLLAFGLLNVTLRPLAAAVGTSDRMLLYYFQDKNELLEAALQVVAIRLLQLLKEAKPPYTLPYDTLLESIMLQAQSAELKPYMVLWLELAAVCGRADLRFQVVAQSICEIFRSWLSEALDIEDKDQREVSAARLLVTIEGVLVLSSIGSLSTVGQALRQTPNEHTRLVSRRSSLLVSCRPLGEVSNTQ